MFYENIRIFSNISNVHKNISLSAGTYFLDISNAYNDYSYKGYAPLEPWTSPKKTEISKILTTTSREHTDSVNIGKIPESFFWVSRSLNIDSISSKEEIYYLEQCSSYKKYISELISYFEPNIIKEKEIIKAALGFRFVHNLKTSTDKKHRKTFIGLHLDSWDPFSLRERNLARNRICINMGKETRYFLFINLTVENMINMIEEKYQSKLEYLKEKETFPHIFMRSFPEYKVIKIGLEPGEYYIAPTENMIHDSTLIGKKYTDVFLTFWGHFKF